MTLFPVDLEHSCANLSSWMSCPLSAFSWLARPMPACLLLLHFEVAHLPFL